MKGRGMVSQSRLRCWGGGGGEDGRRGEKWPRDTK